MTNLFTQDAVYDLCRKADFTHKNARIASAIAMCESAYPDGGKSYANADAVGDQALANDKWGYSYGLFQIRSLRSHKGTGNYRDEDELLRPRFNAKAARTVMRGQGWTAWSVYTSGMYKAYLQDEFPPAPNTYVVLAGDTLSGIASKANVAWTELARWNNLHAPYTIFIGQVLLMADPSSV